MFAMSDLLVSKLSTKLYTLWVTKLQPRGFKHSRLLVIALPTFHALSAAAVVDCRRWGLRRAEGAAQRPALADLSA